MLVAGRRESGPLNCSWAATETSRDTVCLSPMSVKLQNTSICWSNRKKKTDNNSCKVAVPCPVTLKYLNWKFDHQKVCPSLNPSRLPPVLQPAVHRVRGKWGESVQSSWQGGCHHITTITTITKSPSLLRTYLTVDFILQTNLTHRSHSLSLSAHQSQAWHHSCSLRNNNQNCLQSHYHLHHQCV